MSNDVNIILCTFTALVEISFFFLGSGWSLELISSSKQLQRLVLMIIKAWNTGWSPVESLSFLTRQSDISDIREDTIIIYHVLCSMQVLRTQKLHHQKISKGLLSTTSTQMVITNFQTQQWPLSCKQLDLQVSPIWEPTCQRPRSCCYKMIRVTHKNSPPIPPMGISAEWMEWRAFPFQFFPKCPMISCRHRTGHSGDLRWLVNYGEFPPASGNECTKVRRTSQTKRPAWRCHQSWTWWVSQCFPAASRCCKMLQGMISSAHSSINLNLPNFPLWTVQVIKIVTIMQQ